MLEFLLSDLHPCFLKDQVLSLDICALVQKLNYRKLHVFNTFNKKIEILILVLRHQKVGLYQQLLKFIVPAQLGHVRILVLTIILLKIVFIGNDDVRHFVQEPLLQVFIVSEAEEIVVVVFEFVLAFWLSHSIVVHVHIIFVFILTNFGFYLVFDRLMHRLSPEDSPQSIFEVHNTVTLAGLCPSFAIVLRFIFLGTKPSFFDELKHRLYLARLKSNDRLLILPSLLLGIVVLVLSIFPALVLKLAQAGFHKQQVIPVSDQDVVSI